MVHKLEKLSSRRKGRHTQLFNKYLLMTCNRMWILDNYPRTAVDLWGAQNIQTGLTVRVMHFSGKSVYGDL